MIAVPLGSACMALKCTSVKQLGRLSIPRRGIILMEQSVAVPIMGTDKQQNAPGSQGIPCLTCKPCTLDQSQAGLQPAGLHTD